MVLGRADTNKMNITPDSPALCLSVAIFLAHSAILLTRAGKLAGVEAKLGRSASKALANDSILAGENGVGSDTPDPIEYLQR